MSSPLSILHLRTLSLLSTGALPMVEEDGSEQLTPVMVLTNGCQPGAKRQVKRRHRRRKEPCQPCECLDRPREPEERTPRSRREYYRHRGGYPRDCGGDSSSSEEEQNWKQARSWSRERARRARRREQEKPRKPQERQAVELLSVGSDEGPAAGKERPSPQETAGTGLKNRRRPSAKRDERHPHPRRRTPSRRDPPKKGTGPGNSSPAEEDRITKAYEERGSGNETLAAPTGRGSPCHNGAAQQCTDDELEVCRICHCEGDEECPLITPCRCTGSLRFVHPDCLHQWIKSSDTRCCELCKYDFIMETQLKPLRKWEKLQMSTRERRQIFCSVTFHIIAVICVVWSLYVLIDRTAEEIKQGRENGVLEWPFWTKLIVVAIGFTGGLIFMYIQCKVYLQLWRRLKAYNRIIFVQNCPDTVKKGEEKTVSANQLNGKHDSVEVPVPQTETNSHRPPGGAAVPEVAPV
ncbi:hypothetical protein Z043_109028 [Scleropages formosus]|uniref:RING-CH-type domain-containing protein n=1 Tax=Scleropages formosus TaxID=113540 RepID=A0A0P7XB12_SCLFO|nr:hypothetical protein Z043_109028 [Scleropages formosus]